MNNTTEDRIKTDQGYYIEKESLKPQTKRSKKQSSLDHVASLAVIISSEHTQSLIHTYKIDRRKQIELSNSNVTRKSKVGVDYSANGIPLEVWSNLK